MEPSLSLILITLGLVFAIHTILVESQIGTSPPPPPPPPSPSPSPPPPPPPSQSPPPPPPPPPSPSPSPPPLYQPLPPPQASPPLPKGTRTLRPPLPPHHRTKQNTTSERGKGRRPPPHKNKLNTGKTTGLLFAGVAAILQIGVVGFLVFKRRQLLVIKDRYETCST